MHNKAIKNKKSDWEVITDTPVLRRFLPRLFLLFVGSGCAALIYEVVWLQLLQLVIGSTGISMGVLLGTFIWEVCVWEAFCFQG